MSARRLRLHIRNLQMDRPRLACPIGPHEASAFTEFGDGVAISDLVLHPVDRLQGRLDLDLAAELPGRHRVAGSGVCAALDLDPRDVVAL